MATVTSHGICHGSPAVFEPADGGVGHSWPKQRHRPLALECCTNNTVNIHPPPASSFACNDDVGSDVGFKVLDVGCWMLGLGVGCWMLDVGCRVISDGWVIGDG
jgi:hypothetical protein